MSKENSKLEVWLDANFLGQMHKVGVLAHDRGQVRFHYDKDWLKHPSCFALDPDLTLDAEPFFPKSEAGNFGVFLDSSPDRWGQTLMKRREMLEAKDEGRKPRNLYAWDFLIGVQDSTRQGALRFRREGETEFLGTHALPAPPITSLREMAAVAHEITNKRIDDLDALRRWLSVLVAPGASLGGARPKANFTDTDSSLWIAKFPARDDERDVGAWEMVTRLLAERSEIEVPPARLIRFGDYSTFCVRRFDRADNGRVFYASAMTMLKRSESEGSSYLDLAEFIQNNGDTNCIAHDLEQLFRRVVFNVAVSNRDDHLRNHGFILSKAGWRLSPAFDMNPSLDKHDHVLNLDDSDNRPNMDTVRLTAEWYGLSVQRADEIVNNILATVAQWRDVAAKVGISNADIELMAPSFGIVEVLRSSQTVEDDSTPRP